MPTYRAPAAKAKVPAQSEFELLSAGFPDPSPDLEDIPVNPDLIPRAGALRDHRLNRITSYEQARIDAYNTDMSREMGGLATNVPVSPPVFEKLVSTGSSQNGDAGGRGSGSGSGMRAVDLAKGWPKPRPRAYGAGTSNTTKATSTAGIGAEDTFDYAFKKYGVGDLEAGQGPITFGASTSPTPAHVSPFIVQGASSPDDTFHAAGDNGVLSDSGVISVLEDGVASFRLFDAPQPIKSPDSDAAAAHKLSASQMIGCSEEEVEELLINQAGHYTNFKLSKLENSNIDPDAVRYFLSLELLGWAESLGLYCPNMKELFMMSKNDFYRFFSKVFRQKDNAQDLVDFQQVEAQRFGVADDGESSIELKSRSHVTVASEYSYSIDEQDAANGEHSSNGHDVDDEQDEYDEDDDEDDGGVVFGGRTRFSTPSIS